MPAQIQASGPSLRPFLKKVAAGENLTPHLSELVNKKGIVLPGANQSDRGKDIDTVLTRQGLHHFHTSLVTSTNPRGRSGVLLFADVTESEFRIIALASHQAFERGSPEQSRFFSICRAYLARDVPPGQAFMANPVMASGHSLTVTLFADKCEDQIDRIDPLLDDPAYIDGLYENEPVLKNGEPISRPARPLLEWHFEDLQFGILDRQTGVFFCIYPFFAR